MLFHTIPREVFIHYIVCTQSNSRNKAKKEETEWSSFMKSHKEMSIVLLAAAIQYTEFWQLLKEMWKPCQTEKAWGSWILESGIKKEGERESKTHTHKKSVPRIVGVYIDHILLWTHCQVQRDSHLFPGRAESNTSIQGIIFNTFCT